MISTESTNILYIKKTIFCIIVFLFISIRGNIYSYRMAKIYCYISQCNASVQYLLFTNWVQGPYQEIQAQGFSYSPSLRGLFGKPRACISWYGTSTQLVNSLLHDPFLESE